jgi:hypothetical protein
MAVVGLVLLLFSFVSRIREEHLLEGGEESPSK